MILGMSAADSAAALAWGFLLMLLFPRLLEVGAILVDKLDSVLWDTDAGMCL